MPATAEQNAWVLRVLGVSLNEPAAAPAKSPAGFNGSIIWRDAKEAVDANMTALGQALRSYGDPDLDRIAELGLHGIGTTQNVALAKALIEYQTAGGEEVVKATTGLRTAVANYRTLLATGLVRVIDEVPLPKAPAICATLGTALDEIERVIG